MCTKKRCTSLPAGFGLDRKLPVIGFGCLRNACLVAIRDATGVARVALLTETSKTKWSKSLDTVASEISIIGVGDRSFVAGYATAKGVEVVRFDRDGGMSSVWRSSATNSAPALSWSSGRLLIAYKRGDELGHEIVPLSP
jgi:hypothetical protein